jgi:hypothetical protein
MCGQRQHRQKRRQVLVNEFQYRWLLRQVTLIVTFLPTQETFVGHMRSASSPLLSQDLQSDYGISCLLSFTSQDVGPTYFQTHNILHLSKLNSRGREL